MPLKRTKGFYSSTREFGREGRLQICSNESDYQDFAHTRRILYVRMPTTTFKPFSNAAQCSLSSFLHTVTTVGKIPSLKMRRPSTTTQSYATLPPCLIMPRCRQTSIQHSSTVHRTLFTMLALSYHKQSRFIASHGRTPHLPFAQRSSMH